MELKLIYMVSSLNSSEKYFTTDLEAAKEKAKRLAIRRDGADIHSFMMESNSWKHLFGVLPSAEYVEPIVSKD